ncbi:hypothetical protein TIFTF001_017651, partial [Ficus carica]
MLGSKRSGVWARGTPTSPGYIPRDRVLGA